MAGFQMSRTQFPRVNELLDCIAEPTSPEAYSPSFEGDLARAFWQSWEQELQGLEEEAWTFLKAEASQYLAIKDKKGRGWQPLFNILNQAYAYNYLKSVGCSNISFIPRSDQKSVQTPDLEGFRDRIKVICEVKTINISQDEVNARLQGTARSGDYRLDEKFFHQLDSVIAKARKQLIAYDPSKEGHHLVYVCVRLDDWPGGCDSVQFQQIERYLSADPTLSMNTVFRINGRIMNSEDDWFGGRGAE